MRALVLGAGGFVGRHLVSHLRQEGDDVACGVLSLKDGSSDCENIYTDITLPQTVLDAVRSFNPDVVYLLAGMAFVPEAEKNFENAIRVNVIGAANVARICAEELTSNGALVFASSAEVYGAIQPSDLPITEATAVNPANNYSLSKRMGELAVERYCAPRKDMRRIIVRPFNHIGKGQDARFVSANFARQLALIAHGLSSPVLRVGNLEAKRDFSDVRDVVRAYRRLACGSSGVFNVGSGVSVSISEILKSLIEIAGVDVTIEKDPERMRASEVPEIYGATQKISETCNWQATIPLRDTLQDLYQWWFDKVQNEEVAKAI
jgi:GDP-4-dehydro-6-deoxy-D-mannose reductase